MPTNNNLSSTTDTFSIYSLVMVMLASVLLGIVMLVLSMPITNTMDDKTSTAAYGYSVSSASVMAAAFVVILLMGGMFLGCSKAQTQAFFSSNSLPTSTIILPVVMICMIFAGTLFLYFSEVTVRTNSTSTEEKSGILYLQISYGLLATWGLLALLLGINFYYCAKQGQHAF